MIGKFETSGRKAGGVRLRAVNAVTTITLTVLILLLMQVMLQMNQAITQLEEEDERLVANEQVAYQLEQSSRILTEKARTYAFFGEDRYLAEFLREYAETSHRAGVEALEDAGMSNGIDFYYQAAYQAVQNLEDMDCHALELVCASHGTTLAKESGELASYTLTPEEAALSPQEQHDAAVTLLFSEKYQAATKYVSENVRTYNERLMDAAEAMRAESARSMRAYQLQQQVLSLLILVAVLAIVLSFSVLVVWPLRGYIIRVRHNEPLAPSGAFELQYLAKFYNAIFEERQRTHARLQYEAERDQLTGLYNRRAFNNLFQGDDASSYAMLLIDVDHFKEVNDTHGHSVGDETLQKLAETLAKTFRSTDFAFRIGGDEFAVIMTDVDESLRDVICRKIEEMRASLRDDSDGRLSINVSIGVAFSESGADLEMVSKKADKALYRVKEAGRNGFAFYGKEDTVLVG